MSVASNQHFCPGWSLSLFSFFSISHNDSWLFWHPTLFHQSPSKGFSFTSCWLYIYAVEYWDGLWWTTENRKISGRRQWSNKSYPIFVMDKQIEIFGRRWRQFEVKKMKTAKKSKEKMHTRILFTFYDSLPGRHKHSILSSSEATMYACTWLGQSPTILPRIKLLFASWLIFDEMNTKGFFFFENRAKRNKISERAWASVVTLYIIHNKTFARGIKYDYASKHIII